MKLTGVADPLVHWNAPRPQALGDRRIQRQELATKSCQVTCIDGGAFGPIQAPGGNFPPHPSQVNTETPKLIPDFRLRFCASR